MKIYTRSGDTGETGTLGPERVPKDDARLGACGDIDELNAAIGCALTSRVCPEVATVLTRVQNELFVLGGNIALTEEHAGARIPRLTLEHVGRLEVDIDRYNETLDELHDFVLPGGDNSAAILHLARTVCRRAERSVVTLSHSNKIEPPCMGYLNRLSDLLFVMARYQNRHAGRGDVVWSK